MDSDTKVEMLATDMTVLRGELRDVVDTVKSLATSTVTVQAEVRQVNQNVAALQTMFKEDRDAFRLELRALAQQQAAAAKPNWPLMVAILGVAITATGLIGGVLAYAVRAPIELANDKQQTQLDKLDGMRERVTRLETLQNPSFKYKQP